jgi:hypothetical protein
MDLNDYQEQSHLLSLLSVPQGWRVFGGVATS